jgi:hypothetical protein
MTYGDLGSGSSSGSRTGLPDRMLAFAPLMPLENRGGGTCRKDLLFCLTCNSLSCGLSISNLVVPEPASAWMLLLRLNPGDSF